MKTYTIEERDCTAAEIATYEKVEKIMSALSDTEYIWISIAATRFYFTSPCDDIDWMDYYKAVTEYAMRYSLKVSDIVAWALIQTA